MKLRNNNLSSIVIALLFCVCITAVVAKNYRYPLNAWKVSPIKEYVVQDLSGTLIGMKRLSADIAWVQLLQYYGSPEKPLNKDVEYSVSLAMTKYLFGMKVEEEDEHNTHILPGGEAEGPEHVHYHANIEGGVYPDLLAHCYRVAQLDPFFSHVYLFGAGALAWNLQRPEEAVKLLQYGIDSMEKYEVNLTKDVQQPFWQMNLYMAAIIYRNAGKYDKMISLLEVAVGQRECPNVVRTILASIYQKQGKNAPALKLWLDIYESKDSTYKERSEEKINELRLKLGI